MSDIKTREKLCPTNDYKTRILCISPRKRKTLPDEEHFRAFFSKFGSIVNIHRHQSWRSNDNVYLIYKTDDAVQGLKRHFAMLGEDNFWKQTCHILYNRESCPAKLIETIKAKSTTTFSISETSGQATDELRAGQTRDVQVLGKRSRAVVLDLEQQHKKQRFNDEPITPELATSTTISGKPNDYQQSLHTTPPKSALQLAQEAADIASSSSKRRDKSKGHRDVQEELEQLRTERDKAFAQRDEALKSCESLERELKELKKSIKWNKKQSGKVLRLVTASLQGLQESLVGVEE